MFNEINAIKRSFVYLTDGKTSATENYELNVFRALGKLELQLRGLQREMREIES
jgi:hypothetical protein